nr:isoform 2 of putative casein kinase ii subunit beta-4 [Quercus suber]
MYRDRLGGGGGSSRSEMVASGGGGPLDRKRIINDALDKHLKKSSPSTSRVNGRIHGSSKDKERIFVPSTSTGKSQQHQHQ